MKLAFKIDKHDSRTISRQTPNPYPTPHKNLYLTNTLFYVAGRDIVRLPMNSSQIEIAYCAEDYNKEMSAENKPVSYELPDGRELNSTFSSLSINTLHKNRRPP